MATKNNRVEQLASDYAHVFGTEEGQRVLEDLLAQARVLDTTYEPGDPHGTHWWEGRRSLALHILSTMRMNEADYRRLFLDHPLTLTEE